MLNMDFKSNRIAWVDNIYQKFEAMCQDVEGIRILEKTKYIESQVQIGCDNVRKFCAEVMQDLLLPAACDVKGSISDLSFIYDVDGGMCRKSKVVSPIEEKMLAPAELDEYVPLGKGSSPEPLPDESYSMNLGEACGALTKKSIPNPEEVAGCNYLERAGENHNNRSDACGVVSSAHPSDSVLSTEVIAVAGTLESHNPTSLPSVVCLENGYDQHSKSSVFDFVLPSSEIGRSNDFDWEEASMSTDVIEPSVETIEGFEDVKFEENCLYPEAENGVYFISIQNSKKKSYKKKLRDVFASKIRSAKKLDHEQLKIHSSDGNVKTNHCEEISMSSTHTEDLNSRKLLTHDISEFEWELM